MLSPTHSHDARSQKAEQIPASMSSRAAADETAASGAESHWNGRKPAIALGQPCHSEPRGVVPGGKHLLLTGATEGQPLRTYEIDLEGGSPQPLGPPDFTGIAVAKDGKRIAGGNAAGETVVFDSGTQKMQVVAGIAPQEIPQKWTKDGQALIVSSGTPWQASVYRVETTTGKRTLLQTVELSDRAGSRSNLASGLAWAEDSKTYVYNPVRELGTLYVVEGLE